MNLFNNQSKNWSEVKANDSWALFKIKDETKEPEREENAKAEIK